MRLGVNELSNWLLHLHCCVQLAVVGLFSGLKALGWLIFPMVPLVCFLMIWLSWIPLHILSVVVQHSSSFDKTSYGSVVWSFGVILVCFSFVIKIFLLISLIDGDVPQTLAPWKFMCSASLNLIHCHHIHCRDWWVVWISSHTSSIQTQAHYIFQRCVAHINSSFFKHSSGHSAQWYVVTCK